jgi:hypothetical protein
VNEHQCHAVGCTDHVPPRLHMCVRHWRMVPLLVQKLIWKHYRPGQEIDKKPSVAYLAVAFTSISCVALQEGKPLPELVSQAEKKEGPQ